MFNNNDSIKCHLKKNDNHIDEISKQIQTLSPENKELVFTPNIFVGIKISVSSLRDILYGKYRLEIDDIKNNYFELYDENDERIITDIDAIIKQNAGAIYAIYEHKNRRL